jgi:putative transposase
MKRVFLPGVSLHIIRRGINRTTVFGDNEDFELFLALLQTGSGTHDVPVHAYTLMTNHYHLITTPNRAGSLSLMMRDVGREYVKHFNRRYERIGTLWTGPFRDIPITDERQLLTCLRYVEQNPVRAHLVSTPDEYRWSTYRTHALGEPHGWIVPHAAYVALGATPADRQHIYRALCEPDLTDAELVRQRHGLPGLRGAEMVAT